jgi:hypothetical protein
VAARADARRRSLLRVALQSLRTTEHLGCVKYKISSE